MKNASIDTIAPVTIPERWIDSRHACQHLGVSVVTLRRWVKAGRIKPKRTPGGLFRFRASDLDTLLA